MDSLLKLFKLNTHYQNEYNFDMLFICKTFLEITNTHKFKLKLSIASKFIKERWNCGCVSLNFYTRSWCH